MMAKDSVRVGAFLAVRSLVRGNRSVSVLIVMILTLIFLNLVAVGGLLLGLIRGSEVDFINNYSGTLIIEPLEEEKYIQFPYEIIEFTKSVPGYVAHSARIVSGGKLESGYKEKRVGSEVSNVSASITGLDPEAEDGTTNLSKFIREGRWLEPGDRDAIVLGSVPAGRGASFSIGESLEDVYVGDKILATFDNSRRREYTVVGIVEAKPALLNLKAYVTKEELADILGHTDERLSEISIKTDDPMRVSQVKKYFLDAGYDEYNSISTFSDALGSSITDINDTFSLIGNVIGGIGLMVGGITIFILTFVNAVSKRRFIGILKASGVTSSSVVISYVLQGLFYSIVASILGSLFLYGFLVPYFNANPIDFPFSDGIIYVTDDYVIARIVVLLTVSVVSGYVPARLITKQNTLNAILGR